MVINHDNTVNNLLSVMPVMFPCPKTCFTHFFKILLTKTIQDPTLLTAEGMILRKQSYFVWQLKTIYTCKVPMNEKQQQQQQMLYKYGESIIQLNSILSCNFLVQS